MGNIFSTAQAENILHKALLIRLIEEEIAERYPRKPQPMRCPTHLSIGQELVPSVIGELLQKEDLAVSTHRGHAHYLGKGGDPKAMIAEIYGRVTGCSKGKGGSMHLIDTSVGFMGTTAIVGGTIPVGVGLGLSLSLEKGNHVSCVFLGDGSIEEGVFYESLNFACVRKLPILFVCENNFFSVYSPLTVRQPEGRKIHEMVQAVGCTTSQGDGNDLIETWNLLSEAINHIRNGQGPYFVELHTFRWREHCGPFFDDDLGYRNPELVEYWMKKDPIANITQTLLAQELISQETIDSIRNSVEREVQEAFDFALQSPFPEKHEAFTNVYANPINNKRYE